MSDYGSIGNAARKLHAILADQLAGPLQTFLPAEWIAEAMKAGTTILKPHLAKAGVNLKVLMGYRLPGEEGKAAIELYPVAGKRAAKAAAGAGLTASSIPALHVAGDDKPGLMHAIASALAAAGINISFLVAQVVAKKYTAIWGFQSAEAARKAAAVIRPMPLPTVAKPNKTDKAIQPIRGVASWSKRQAGPPSSPRPPSPPEIGGRRGGQSPLSATPARAAHLCLRHKCRQPGRAVYRFFCGEQCA
jgi:hypothetical protein